MIIVAATIKTNQPEPHQFLNLGRRRVNHPHNRLPLALDLPVYKEQVRKYLHIVKYKFRLIILNAC